MDKIELLKSEMRQLIRSYVNLLENGRERILLAGGQCDPVDTMEKSDPALRRAREVLADLDSYDNNEGKS